MKFCSIEVLHDFTSCFEGCARALWHIVLFDLGLNVAVKFHILVVVTSIILWNVTFQSSTWVACDPEQGP